MSFSNQSNKTRSVNDMLLETSRQYDKKAAEVSYLTEAMDSVVYDSSSVNNQDKAKNIISRFHASTKELGDMNNTIIELQKSATEDINKSAEDIENYKQTLKNNNNLFQKYTHDIQNKMQLVATRDRMLQLSQERNIYKKKVIYVLFSIIITLLIAVVSAYTFFGKKNV
jgi:hypothetical protein